MLVIHRSVKKVLCPKSQKVTFFSKLHAAETWHAYYSFHFHLHILTSLIIKPSVKGSWKIVVLKAVSRIHVVTRFFLCRQPMLISWAEVIGTTT